MEDSRVQFPDHVDTHTSMKYSRRPQFWRQSGLQQGEIGRSHHSDPIAVLGPAGWPRDRPVSLGPGWPSESEIPGLLVRSGFGGINESQLDQCVLVELGGLPGLHRIECSPLREPRGSGPGKAAQRRAAVELVPRLALRPPERWSPILSPADVAALRLFEISATEQEERQVVPPNLENQ